MNDCPGYLSNRPLMSLDEENRRLYEAREMFLHDQATRMYEAKEEGLEEGMKIGKKEGKETVAKNLLSKGMDDEFVIETTGLDQSIIDKLKKSLRGLITFAPHENPTPCFSDTLSSTSHRSIWIYPPRNLSYQTFVIRYLNYFHCIRFRYQPVFRTQTVLKTINTVNFRICSCFFVIFRQVRVYTDRDR